MEQTTWMVSMTCQHLSTRWQWKAVACMRLFEQLEKYRYGHISHMQHLNQKSLRLNIKYYNNINIINIPIHLMESSQNWLNFPRKCAGYFLEISHPL